MVRDAYPADGQQPSGEADTNTPGEPLDIRGNAASVLTLNGTSQYLKSTAAGQRFGFAAFGSASVTTSSAAAFGARGFRFGQSRPAADHDRGAATKLPEPVSAWRVQRFHVAFLVLGAGQEVANSFAALRAWLR